MIRAERAMLASSGLPRRDELGFVAALDSSRPD
jgi:hypothetical protein